ncbi:uncharacterized protein LOC113550213 [Rhopalosiphum maidis]|uniref:uncharacterized protein LOC113550213 n=1 Tax=Rhopalosiphum maidis TaxID=43146 RepID=UPI000EFFD694|nr:uncharacterized protein LOC113550213 [Rhopalosiphum maidis]XP_026807722.1 uncharacterized protein LOC113550213 [Rhopalosiphum maidis]XP_026807724.1 uncharacterized protein LOC113550213 [Rhopalosiphum maidis]
MSVIIRLQNLPWAANAADIRQYFQGLSIPEGGVHIVGGEKGDVFISFSTDEDARQAMLSDGGCIKDVQIRLLLSSRNEMQKVIDTARQQTLYNAYMQQNLMQQPQIPIVGSLQPPLTAKVLPQPQQQARPDRLGAQMLRRQPLMDNMSVLMPQDKQQQMQQQLLSPKSLENRDRDDKGNKRSDRSRSKSRERRSKSSRSGGGGGRRERSRSRDRRRRDRSRGRDRSRDRYRGDGRSSSSRGSGGKSQRSRSPVANKGVDGKLIGDQQAQINPWSCQYDNMQQQQAAMAGVENHQPATMMNNAIPGGIAGFPQFRSPPQPPIIPVILPQNSFHQPQQQQQQQQQQQPPPLMNRWPSSGGNRSHQQQQQPYVPDNDFRANVYGGGGSDDEDDRQTEFDNNFHGRYNDNSAPGMRRGPPGQDFREQRGFGPNRGGPRFHKPQQAVPPVVGQHNRGGGAGQRSFDEFGNSSGPRFNHQQHQQPPRYGGHNIQEGGGRGGRPSRFSSINENGKPYSRFNQAPQQQQQSRRDNDEGRPVDFDDSKRIPPRYNDRYRYDVRNAQVPHSEGLCVEVNNMSNPFSYGDIRKLFEGIHIDGSAIKIQKHRQGVAFVRFDNNHNKNLAMKVNGTAYKGNHVVVKHLDDEAYERDNTDDRPYPSTAGAPNIVDHVDLVDDDDDEEGATDQPAVSSDKKKSNRSKTEDEGSDDDDDDDNNDLVVCEKSSNKDALSTEDGGDEQRKDPPPTKYLKLKQLPVTVTEEDVMNEFDGGSDVRRVTFYPDGEFMGAALEFINTEAAESALKRYDCVLLGSTPVPVLRCSYKEYTQIKRKSGGGGRRFSNDNSGGGRHHHHGHHHHHGNNNHHQQAPSSSSPVPMAPPPPNVSGGAPVVRSNCLYVYGLPTTVTNTDITQFFSDSSVLPDKIHIMLSKFGRPTGESYCEFGSAQQASAAMVKNQTYMGPNLVCVEPINRSLMIQAITKPMQQHCNNHHQDMSWGGGGGPPSRQQHHHQRPQQYGGHNNSGPPYGGGGGRPQQQQFNMNNGGGRGGGGGGYTPRIRGPGPGPNAGPEGFGQPGCVIALDNVPYRADVQQIVDFFEGFELNSQNVIRRFNDFGKPTGEARVNLRNPQEASRAVRALQNKSIFNRPVRLTLL